MESKTWPGKKVLIVEDDKFGFEFIRISLRDKGLEILHSADGEQALKIFNENPDLDLILLDIQIPIIDGFTVCKMIREKDQEIPIIVQTAYVLNDEQSRCKEAGCNDYLSKPLNMEKLIDLMDKYLS